MQKLDRQSIGHWTDRLSTKEAMPFTDVVNQFGDGEAFFEPDPQRGDRR